MKTPISYEPDQWKELARALREGEPLVCPSCGVPLDLRPVPPRDDVSYVRDRLWLVCPSCHRTAVLDRREPGP